MKNPLIFAYYCGFYSLLRYMTHGVTINNKFPNDFKFGVATAAYQIEGAWNTHGKGETIWDRFLHQKSVPVHENADIACDSYHNYLEDVKMLKHLGVDFYRFSLSWSRILPTGYINRINQEGVEYYKNLILALKANNIEPYVTLYHWDLPQPLQDIGGWPNPLLVDYFADYARLAFDLFGDNVKNWMTFNEPKQICVLSYGLGIYAPGITADGIAPYLCAHTIIKAHAKAYHIYDQEFRSRQNGRVSYVVDTFVYVAGTDDDKDKEAAERRMQFNLGWYANPVYHPDGNYPAIMIDSIRNRSKKEGFSMSRLPEFTQEEIKYIQGTYDFFSINSYTTRLTKWRDECEIGDPSWENDMCVITYEDLSWEVAASPWLKVVPSGMRTLLQWIDKKYDHPEILITENGYSDNGHHEDENRINYLQQYLENVLQAILIDNITITGYTVWSLMDNYEWSVSYRQHFGLYHVDFNSTNRTRTPKKSVGYYKQVIASKSLTNSC